MSENNEKLTTVEDYLFLTTANSKSYKRCKKKLVKKNVWKEFEHSEIKNQDEYVDKIHEHFKLLQKSSKWKKISNIGVLLDNCVIMADITTLVNVPNEYDILCLNANVKNYIWNDVNNNIYWNKTEINDTCNFIINKNSLSKLLPILKTCNTWSGFLECINKLNVFTVSGNLLSEMEDSYIYFPVDKYNSKSTNQIEKQNILQENEKYYIEKLKKIPKPLSNVSEFNKIQISLLPSISLICPYTDKNRFFNTIYTFLKLDYPRDKLELVVVDTNKSDKYLKRLLPDDSRIKVLNIGSKSDENTEFSLGYMLNLGVKYAQNELICHFFDTNCYIWQSFTDIVKYYLLSNRDIMMSCDTGILNSNSSTKINIQDIGNMIYKKAFWKVLPFNSHESNNYRLIYKFIYNRYSCVSHIPFVLWSFLLNDGELKKSFVNVGQENLTLDLNKLVPECLKESFNEMILN